jgi:Ni,Fe-hydrogenase III small subunit/formate hydrogenlyase subunit 6/NADH:ubiquinone oxidoreductase subunit I
VPSLILTRLRQGRRTLLFPETEPVLPERFRGLPTIDQSRCPSGCTSCTDACPTEAITVVEGLQLDLGRCLFCPECSNACPEGAIQFTRQYRLATSKRDDLVLTEGETLRLAGRLAASIYRVLGRSLKLRQVSAGGCNGCEADVNVLNTVVFDLGRFGIQFVASPRHADGLLVTGAISQNMRRALEKTYQAVPDPKIVIAVGACAISGGPFRDHAEVLNGADKVLPIDLFVPGCPPHPVTILDGLLRLLGKIKDSNGRSPTA